MNKILTKQEFYQKSIAGLLGNSFRVWTSYEDYVRSKYKGPITLRYLIKDSGYFVPSVAYENVGNTLAELIRNGADLRLFTFGEIPTKDKEYRLLQGEICYLSDGLNLQYTRGQGNLRHALEAHSTLVTGVRAKLILQQTMDINSYNDVMDLLDKYDGAAIEFTVFSGCMGNLPNRNTIIWEVRNY